MTTDGELMRAVQRGDTEAFAALVTRHRVRAEAYTASILGDHALAEDAVQDCFVRIYTLRGQYRHELCFEKYLRAMIRNRCIDLIRSRGARERRLPPTPVAGADSPEEVYLRGERRLRLMNAIDRLKPDERALLLGYAYERRPYR